MSPELRRWLALIVTAALAVGCGASGDGNSRGDADEGRSMVDLVAGTDFSVDVEFPRHLHQVRVFHVGVRNHGERTLEMRRVAVRSPLFDDLPVGPEQTTVRPVGRRTLPAPVGTAICLAPPGPSHVVVTLEETDASADGVVIRSFEGLVAVEAAVLERVHATECGQRFVAETMSLGFADVWSVEDGTVHTTLDVVPLAPVTATVDGLRGTVLFDLRAEGFDDTTVLARLDGDLGAVSIPVEFRVTRCDPHAVAESKKAFSFATWITVDGHEQVYVTVEPAGTLRTALDELVARCIAVNRGPSEPARPDPPP